RLRPVPDAQVLLLVVAEDALVLPGQVDALAPLGAAVDQVARENHAVRARRRQLVEQVEGLVVAAVEVADHDGSRGCTHGFRSGGSVSNSQPFNRRTRIRFMKNPSALRAE